MSVVPATALPRLLEAKGLIPSGRLVELSGAGARLTLATELLCEAQAHGETVAWIQPRGAGLFPPDLDDAGLDLDSLLVVHVPAKQPYAVPKAAEMLLRSGALGAAVLDLVSTGAPDQSGAWQNRLAALAREHQSLVVMLTGDRPTSGPLVSVRVAPERQRVPGGFLVTPAVTKNKSGLPLGLEPFIRRGPRGCP
jgi:hypothetical protein